MSRKYQTFNQTCYEINDSKKRIEVHKNIKRIGNYSILSKYYNFLNRKNLSELKDGDFRVCLSSYGKKYLLFLTKINGVNHNIFINKKNESMIDCEFKFFKNAKNSEDDLYEGTLFDGEVVKNDKDQWIFIVNDLPYCKGKNIVIKHFNERQTMIEGILRDEFNNGHHLNMTYIIKKRFFTNEYIQDLSTRYRDSLSYKNSGLYFKNVHNFSDNYLYVFPECRTDHQVLHALPENIIKTEEDKEDRTKENQSKENQSKEDQSKDENEEEDDIFGEVESVIIKAVPVSLIQSNISRPSDKLSRKCCKFLIKPTTKPEVYELYCRSVDKHIEKYSFAGVNGVATSKFLKDLFKGYTYDSLIDITTLVKDKIAIFVECFYHKQFKKWIPYKRCDEMDHHTFINEVTILLDNTNESDSEDDSDAE